MVSLVDVSDCCCSGGRGKRGVPVSGVGLRLKSHSIENVEGGGYQGVGAWRGASGNSRASVRGGQIYFIPTENRGFVPLRRVESTPDPDTCESIAIHLPFLARYFIQKYALLLAEK